MTKSVAEHATFDRTRWIHKLAESLEKLAASQSRYDDDRVKTRAHLTRRSSMRPDWYDTHPESDNLRLLYRLTLTESDPNVDRHYQPLRNVLNHVLDILRQHPVLSHVSAVPGGEFDFRLDIAGRQAIVQLLEVAVGLMTRYPDPSPTNYTQAARDLDSLLGLHEQSETTTLPDGLNTGHHLLLFFGIEPTESMQICERIRMVPFEEVKGFVGEHVLDRIAHDVVNLNISKRISAMLTPFTWKPVLCHPDDFREQQEQWGFEFYREARTFLEMLAVFFSVPVVPLANVYHCIQPSAARLLGHLDFNSRVGRNTGRSVVDPFATSIPLSPEEIAPVVHAFARRETPDWRRYAPIVPRLAQSLTRRGPFALEDKILDVAITLERMYQLNGAELTFKLKTRAACFLETDTRPRMFVFQQLGDLYKVRSDIIHGRNRSGKRNHRLNPENMKRTFRTGFSLARRTLIKLLDQGPPDSWDDLVISIPEPQSSS